MIIIKPEIITDAKLISSNVPETDAPLWDNTINYLANDMVIYMHRVYRAISNNHNIIPTSDPLIWQDLGATNRYRLFDNVVGNPTTNLGTIDYVIRPGTIVSGISFFNLTAAKVRVIMTDPSDGVVYDNTILLVDLSAITSFYSYFYSMVNEPKTEITLVDLPNYPLADIRIIIDNGIEIASCGEVVLGSQRVLGYTNYGTTIGIRDYSRKEVDEFGNFIIVPRKFAKFADYDVSFRNSELASIQRFLASIRTTPVVYIGNPQLEETIVYGYYKDFQIVISDLNFSDSSITVEGLT